MQLRKEFVLRPTHRICHLLVFTSQLCNLESCKELSGMTVGNEVKRGRESINCFSPPCKRFTATLFLQKELVRQGCESCASYGMEAAKPGFVTI